MLVAQPSVALGHDDRGVAQNVLSGFEASTLLEPAAGESVAQLMGMESLHAAVFSHLAGEARAVPQRHQSPDPEPKLRP